MTLQRHGFSAAKIARDLNWTFIFNEGLCLKKWSKFSESALLRKNRTSSFLQFLASHGEVGKRMLEIFLNFILFIYFFCCCCCSPQMTGQIGLHASNLLVYIGSTILKLLPQIISRFFLEEVKARDQIFITGLDSPWAIDQAPVVQRPDNFIRWIRHSSASI